MLYLALVPGEYIGWGVCSKYLANELNRSIESRLILPEDLSSLKASILNGPVFHAIGDHHLTKVMDITGTRNFGYTFFENLLPDAAINNASDFDVIFAGSTWCRNRLDEKGITWTDTLIQGIDPELFYPLPLEKSGAQEYFVIFSGGKFELRKGQDIVIRAVSIMQDRHKDVLFVNCWHNSWPFSMNTMAQSAWIDFTPQKAWNFDYIKRLFLDNGIDLDRTEFLPRISQDQLRKVYACTDIGLFPNRCEGGTNLVLMEYMACAKPAIATYTSGHKDILTDQNALLLKRMNRTEVRSKKDGMPDAIWEEPLLEDVVDHLEIAYQNRHQIRSLGVQAGEDMKRFTWSHTARKLLKSIGLN